MSDFYSRAPLTPNTPATAEQMNAEFIKIASGFQQVAQAIAAIQGGGSLPSYVWRAYADSLDGTSNFTTGEPGERAYIGFAYNKTVPTPSDVPADYEWSRYRGTDGTDGTSGGFVEYRFLRAVAKPAQPAGAEPAGWSTSIPSGEGRLWMTFATKNAAGNLQSGWAEPFTMMTFLPRGDYAAGTTYYEGDTVSYGGGSYYARTSTLGNAPTGTAQDNAWWKVLAAPGTPGEPATPDPPFSATIDLTSSAAGANLRTIADGAGYTGLSDATITFRVPNGVTITGTSLGSIGIDSGSWPSAYAISIALVVQNGGKVYGGGGWGGDGGSGTPGTAGGAGGDAVYCRTAMSVTIDSGGEIKGGGGGGGGGAGSITGFPEPVSKAGSGGGGGFPNGVGGPGGNGDSGNGNNGIAGTTSGGGAGGTAVPGQGGAGFSGGGAAAAGVGGSGAAGGVAGYAVRKNGNTVPVTNNGTVTGATA